MLARGILIKNNENLGNYNRKIKTLDLTSVYCYNLIFIIILNSKLRLNDDKNKDKKF